MTTDDAVGVLRTPVLLGLYRALVRATPGSIHEKTVERALDYAVGARLRQTRPDDYILRDYLRNARHNVLRGLRRELEGIERFKLSMIPAAEDSTADAIPEASAVTTDLLDRVRAAVAAADPRLLSMLSSMLAELPVASIVETTGIPRRSVERMRARVRVIARTIITG